MQFSAATLSLTAIAAAGMAMAQNAFSVNTPATLIQCQPIQISWTGGQAPYFPRVTRGGQPNDILKFFPEQTGTSLTWTVDLAAGQPITIVINDSTGNNAATSQVTINQGASNCLNASTSSAAAGGSATSAPSSSSSSASSSSSSSASSSSSSSSASSSSAASSSSTRATTASSSSATASAPSSTASSGSGNGAESVRGFSAVVAGLVGVAAAALL